MPEFDSETFEFIPDEDLNGDPEDQMSEGDRLLCTSVLLLSEEIRASQTTSQRLSEAHQKTAGTETEIPKHLRAHSAAKIQDLNLDSSLRFFM